MSKNEIPEEELEAASGGNFYVIGDDKYCKYTATNSRAIRSVGIYAGYDIAKCSAGNGCGRDCLCYGTEHCMERWHVIDSGGNRICHSK